MTTTLDPRVALSPTKLFINNEFVDAADGKVFQTENPANGQILAEVAEGGAEDIDRAVRAARAALDGLWSKFSPSDRAQLMWRLADLIRQHTDELALLESLDNGKPLMMATYVDVPLTAGHIQYNAGWVGKQTGDTLTLGVPYTPDADYLAYTRREPIGVVGQIVPWNYPLVMAALKLGPALATGNCAVLKPAEQTPLSTLRLAELIAEAGFPPGVVNIVPGLGETAGAALAAHPDVDKIAFTGSVEVGKLIVQAAIGNLKKVTLELGGKSPVIIFPDADLDAAVPGAAAAAFFNQGEVCTTGSRLFVHESLFEEVVDGVAAIASNMKIGDGLEPDTEVGPLISLDQLDRVSGYLDASRAEGATFRTGGDRVGDVGYFVQPTVVTDAGPDTRIAREEIFGPVVVASPFSTLEEIAAVANDTRFGLSAGVWTRDVSRAHRMAHLLKVGTVWVNCYQAFDASMPFGGYKESGWGREMGKEALDAYTELKSVCLML
ncbi:MAG: aldehyde dehydrogenase family protein [Acidimicrobiia bacterium]